MKILIADDEAGLVELLSEWLTRKGHEVMRAYDGSEAWKLISENKFQMAFLDLNMPEMTGLEVMQHIRESGLSIKTVMITAYPLMEDYLAKAAGVDEYVTKPFRFEEVQNILDKYKTP